MKEIHTSSSFITTIIWLFILLLTQNSNAQFSILSKRNLQNQNNNMNETTTVINNATNTTTTTPDNPIQAVESTQSLCDAFGMERYYLIEFQGISNLLTSDDVNQMQSTFLELYNIRAPDCILMENFTIFQHPFIEPSEEEESVVVNDPDLLLSQRQSNSTDSSNNNSNRAVFSLLAKGLEIVQNVGMLMVYPFSGMMMMMMMIMVILEMAKIFHYCKNKLIKMTKKIRTAEEEVCYHLHFHFSVQIQTNKIKPIEAFELYKILQYRILVRVWFHPRWISWNCIHSHFVFSCRVGLLH